MKKNSEYHKCDIEKGFCQTMEMFVQNDNHKKGLSWYGILPNLDDLLNRKQFSISKEIKTIGIVYKRDSKDNGIILNYCPFCGEDLRPFRKDYVKKQDGKNENA